MARRNIPSKLADLLKDRRFGSPKVTALSLFPNDGYFLAATNGSWGKDLSRLMHLHTLI